jgi:predicted metalloprotease with PDZ domain
MITVPFRSIALTAALLVTSASHKRKPSVYYEISVSADDPSQINVEMSFEGGPRSIRLAMAVHPEYDDRFWRYITDWRVYGYEKPVAIARDKDNIWRLISHAGYARLSYRIRLPHDDPSNRPAWHTSLRSDGGSINPVDTFLFLPDIPNAEIHVSLHLPGDVVWQVPMRSLSFARGGMLWVVERAPAPPGVQPPPAGSQPRPFPPGVFPTVEAEIQSGMATILDSPILYGTSLRSWSFDIAGVHHSVVYWPLPNATPFDTAQFVDGIQKVAREAVAVFEKPPYPHYQFLLEDGAWGALEHKNSVTIGMPSRDLARDPHMYLPELAHEFFHAWNLMRLYPEGRGVLGVDRPARATGLWLSEGVTMYYAEALTRRAGFPENNKSRSDLLAEELESYYGTPGNTRISPEVASARAADTTGINGDYEPNYYSQGRLIGTALDLIIRDSTHGQRGLDDLMRTLYSRFADKRGFTTDDVQNTAKDVCGCNVDRFFDDHVREPRPIDFNRYLPSLGLRAIVDTIPATDSAGTPLPDTRIWAYPPRSGGRMRVWIQDPSSVWGRADLHTGMELVAFNNAPVDSFPSFRRAFRTIQLGRVVPVDIVRNGARSRINVSITGYSRPRVRIVEDPTAGPAQLERRRMWLSGR